MQELQQYEHPGPGPLPLLCRATPGVPQAQRRQATGHSRSNGDNGLIADARAAVTGIDPSRASRAIGAFEATSPDQRRFFAANLLSGTVGVEALRWRPTGASTRPTGRR